MSCRTFGETCHVLPKVQQDMEEVKQDMTQVWKEMEKQNILRGVFFVELGCVGFEKIRKDLDVMTGKVSQGHYI